MVIDWFKSVPQQFYLILNKTKVMLSEVVQFCTLSFQPLENLFFFIINLIKLIFPVCGLNEITVPLFFFLSCRSEILPCIGDHVVVKNHMTGMDRLANWFFVFLLVVVAMSGHLVTITFCILPWILVQMKSENPIFSIRLFVHLYHLCACMFFYPGVVRYIGPIVGDKKRQYAGLHLDSPGKIIVIPL